MTNKLPKAIIFDWDNTLVEGWTKIQFALNSVFRHYNMPEWDLQTVAANAHRSARDSFPEKFGEDTEAALKIFYDAYKACTITPEALDKSEEMLQLVVDKGIYTAIISNKNGDLLRAEVDEKDWNDYFFKIIGATDCAEDKPSVIPMNEVLSEQEFLPEEVWFIGDTEVDVQCARNFGCTAVVYGDNSSLSADKYFKTHAELIEFLQR